jgi:PAS domain S-box-containing protein
MSKCPLPLCGLGIGSTSDSKRPNVSFRPPTEQERTGAKVGATVESERFTATEDALRRAVDTTPAFIHTARADGYLDYFNRGWLDLLGKSLEDVCGWRWTESVHPDDVDGIVQKWRAALASGEPFEAEARVRCADGTYHAFLHRKVPLHDEQGNIVKWFGSSIDIEDRKCAEEQLRRSTQELQRSEFYLSEGQRLAHMGSWALDSAGFDYWSPELFRIYGLDPASTAPTVQEYLDCIHPEDREFMANLIKRILVEASPFDITKRIVRPNGEVRYCRCVGAPVVENQTLKKYVGTAVDVTEHELLTQELRRREAYLVEENVVLHEELGKTSMFEEVIGTSSVLQTVLARAAKVAPTDSTILIMGETGTGKELIARAIHKRSNRSERPFISVNCAAVPSSLIMSELFGHEKGAFTGAVQRRLGRFELAEGGTIFLDEVGDLPMETQIALLRVLQEREFERVGGTEVLRADVRVISATNRDLQAAIADGAFRHDLYYRLNVFPIKLPPLRDRKEDVPLLVNYFVDRYANRAGKKIKNIQKKSLEALQEYSWPGNVRELQNIIERSLIIGETNEFSVDKSWFSNEPQLANSIAVDHTSTERKLIEAALAQSNGKISGAHGAAAKLGMPPSTLESKIRSLRINKFQFKGV